jgi:GTP-binding protein
MLINIIIVGRPNVGKSTLFNRLVGRRVALVHDMPGVTRDLREGLVNVDDLSFKLIDTAGFDDVKHNFLNNEILEKTISSLNISDIALFLIDGRIGVTSLDIECLHVIRKIQKKILLVVNKCEGEHFQNYLDDIYSLGLGDPILISAEHGRGLDELFDSIKGLVDLSPNHKIGGNKSISYDHSGENKLKLTIVGRPNTGKSTLFNYIVGSDRSLTGDKPGITRDAISTEISFNGKSFNLIDTAGLRKKARVVDVVEKLAAMDTIKAIHMSDLVVLMLDAQQNIDKQDLIIASNVISEGKALIIALNKWDLINNQEETIKKVKDRLEVSLAQIKKLEIIAISSKSGLKVDRLINKVFDIYNLWSRRIDTSKLNKWLEETISVNPPPLSSRKTRIKLRFITQVKSKPPSFVIFTSSSSEISESYKRFLINSLRISFGLYGIPIRLIIRKQKNPYS